MCNKKILNLPAYQFLAEDKRLGKNIICLIDSLDKAVAALKKFSSTDNVKIMSVI